MDLVNGKYLKPLIAISKQQLKHYLEVSGLEWREDSSNQDPQYTKRNAIRLKLIPLLSDLSGGYDSFSKRLFALSDQSLAVHTLLDEMVR
jgi:tRNA(Ile)-lysidine synthase